MNRSILAPSMLAVLLSGCVTGGNIKGDFQCAAPGGTCAPMSVIDAAAVSSIGSARQSNTSVLRSDTTAVPRTVSLLGAPDGTSPSRTSDRVLRVVFPAHIDGDGIYREESAAHAVVENTTWADALTGGSSRSRGVPALRAAGVVPVHPQGSALASLDDLVAARAARRAPSVDNPMPQEADLQSSAIGNSVADPLPAAAPRRDAISRYDLGGSRSVAPLSLAEAAAGLSAPKLPPLDPRPRANYDVADISAVATADTAASTPGGAPFDVAPAGLEKPSSNLASYGSRRVRWKGKFYDVPYRSPQGAQSAAVVAKPPAASAAADLNRAALEKLQASSSSRGAGVVGAVAPAPNKGGLTSDSREAQDRVHAMAAPVILSAMQDGRDAARAAAPDGFKLPLAGLGEQRPEPRP